MCSYIDPAIEQNATLRAFRRSIITLLSTRDLEINTLEKAKLDLEEIDEEKKLVELLTLSSCKDTSDFFSKLSEIITAKEIKADNSLWNEERETKVRLDSYRNLIAVFLKGKGNGTEIELVKIKVDNIVDEEKLIDLIQISVQAMEIKDFLNHI